MKNLIDMGESAYLLDNKILLGSLHFFGMVFYC